jgi:hypothetical protein
LLLALLLLLFVVVLLQAASADHSVKEYYHSTAMFLYSSGSQTFSVQGLFLKLRNFTDLPSIH